jgi:hypothetical protein
MEWITGSVQIHGALNGEKMDFLRSKWEKVVSINQFGVALLMLISILAPLLNDKYLWIH